MSARKPRWEIVRTDAGWHARFRAANGRIVWTTEVYQRRARAVDAISLVADMFYGHVMYGERAVTCLSDRDSWNKTSRETAEIRHIDERPEMPLDLDDAESLMGWAKRQSKVAREIRADRKIHAIKELRSLTGASLFQSKAAMDLVWAKRKATS